MAGKTKVVYFNYYDVATFKGEVEQKLNLVTWIGTENKKQIQDRIMDTGNVKFRLERIKQIEDRYIALEFLRLESISNTYTAKEDEAAKHVDLESNEYIGVNMVVLYDSITHNAMVQRNRGSIGVENVAEYIEENLGIMCRLIPKKDNEEIDDIADDVRSLSFSMSGTQDARIDAGTAPENIIKYANEIGASTVKYEISVGKANNKSFVKKGIIEIWNMMNKNRGSLGTAKMRVIRQGKSEEIDLINFAMRDKINFRIPERGELTLHQVSEEMVDFYKRRRFS